MSSSDPLQRLTLVDLHSDPGPRPGAAFVEQNEFEQTAEIRPPTPTPEEAYQAGLAEGEGRGRAEAAKELQPVLARFEELMRSLGEVREHRLQEAEQELIEVATEIARRVLHAELQLETDAVVRLARACLQEAKEEGTRTLRVNPADAEMVRTHLPELELDLAEQELRIESDPKVSESGVVLETPRACYDGRPGRILDAVALRRELTPEATS
jgi:flagellar assembly protein FliH